MVNVFVVFLVVDVVNVSAEDELALVVADVLVGAPVVVTEVVDVLRNALVRVEVDVDCTLPVEVDAVVV